MKEEEYIIISKTAIQKRIEELKPKNIIQAHEVSILKEILSQSTPLVPELEKAFDEGAVRYCDSPVAIGTFMSLGKEKQDYISNLKLEL